MRIGTFVTRWTLLLASALIMLSVGGCGEQRRWNVLLVTFDTTRADRIGCYGNERIATPALDGLASQGVRFAKAVSVAPITAPSHSSILTGMYPTAHGFRDNGLFVLRESNLTLAEILAKSGYATAAAVGSFPVVSRFGFDQGFELFDDHLTGMYEDYLGNRTVPKDSLFFDERRAAQVNEAVFPWLENRSDEPFFLWVHYFDAHQPFEPPPPYDQIYADDLYNGEIAYADAALGKLLDHMRRLGQLENTLVIMTADHGEGLGEHNEVTHAVLAYDSTLHVPLIIRPPGNGEHSPIVVPDRVSTVDIVPTVLDLLGIKPPEGLHGQSLTTTWRGDRVSPDERARYTPLYYAENLSPRLTHGWGELRVLYEGDMKFIHGPRSELYDLDSDPHELRNLVDQRPEEAARMRDLLAQFIKDYSGAEAATTETLDPELIQRLQSLGYLHGSGGGGETIREVLNTDGIAPQDRVTDLNRMSAAKHLLFQKRPVDALYYTRKLVETGGGSPVYQELHAAALAGAGRLDEAWQIVRERESLGMISEALVLTLAAEQFNQGNHTDARAFLERFAEKSQSAKAYWLQSSLAQQMGDSASSLESLRKALQIDPDFVPARVDLGVHWARIGRLETAEQEFQRAIEQNPYYAKAHYNYGTLLLELNQMDAAGEYFLRAIELAPGYLKAHLALITVNQLNGNQAAAHAALESLAKIAPGSAEFLAAKDLLDGP